MISRDNLNYNERNNLLREYGDVLSRLPLTLFDEIPCLPPKLPYRHLGKTLTEDEWNSIFLS